MKKVYVIPIFIVIISLLAASPAAARSFSIDKVHIKGWIQSNGDLLVNEVFTYTFDGEYSRVRRSIHLDGHDGIGKFEAYELLNKEGTPGFIDMNELRPLELEQKGNDFFASLPASDETKTVFFLYELKNAVRSYDTYSDLTVPFFSKGQNHDSDLHNVTIDFVFPELVRLEDYHGFIHEPDGELVERNEEVVRFHTPVSNKGELTEVRLLFPSSIMKDQSKSSAPVSLEKVLEEENKLLHAESEKKESQSGFASFLYVVAIIFALAAFGLMFLPQRIWRRNDHHIDLNTYDPLFLYTIDRAGKKDDFAFFAGVLSLVERGLVTISDTNTLTRFARDEEAPSQTLSFTYRTGISNLSECENMFLDWLFTRRVRGGTRIFSMNNIFGATKAEKQDGKSMHGHYLRRFRFMQMEKRWFDCFIQNMKDSGLFYDRFVRILGRVLMITVMVMVVLSYFVDSAPGFGIFLYLIISGYLLKKGWAAEGRSQTLGLLGVSMFAAIILIESIMLLPYILLIVSAVLLFMAIPKYILSNEAAHIRANIRTFRKQLQQEGISSTEDGTQLDRLMGRALILRAKKFTIEINESEEFMKAAPLSAFILSEGSPMDYLLKTWKLSKPPREFYKTKKQQSKDGGTYFDSGGGGGSSGGGDSGGGAGAD
ncbi:DUF2207 domain-containing protein [Bacillus sp. FJAT-49711]|uniref:DUF2207 domain-containing protein n=1 Tax=Bacillus sp. FJAT-49711 TaxID=2833585 RepID=UPI001BC9837B|nr:DUF2207 domain-containing protein [Bacillus sp. FJAT-49711]MBS4220736.1 DUF2207 domain-containing protein [Bacillus sp. FJAT-49711]